MNRRTFNGLAAAALLAGVTGCNKSGSSGSGSSGGSGLKIGLAVPNTQAPFFNIIRQSIEKNGKDGGHTVVTVDAKDSAETQVSQIQDLITQNVDVIIYIPAGAAAATVPVKNAKSAKIPVVTVDRNPDGAPGDTFIATDSVAAAKKLAEYVVKNAGKRTHLAIVAGQQGTTPEQDRDKGFKEGLTGSSIKEVARQYSNAWHKDEGFNITQDLLQAHPEIDIIFGRADDLALGAAQAARGANRSDIMIVGFDGDPNGLAAVKSGELAATICQQTNLMGKLAIDSAVKLKKGESVPATQLQDGVLVTKDNAEKYIATHP